MSGSLAALLARAGRSQRKVPMSRDEANFWNLIHAERRRLLALLETLTDDQWAYPSLCGRWTVEQVTAHLTAAAHTGTLAWIFSIVRAGFNPAKHNDRLLSRYLGETPDHTLNEYRASVELTVSPTKDYAAFLGETIVHGQDIAQPLGLNLTPDPTALLEVAQFFAAKDFAVNSKTLVSGLRLHATDADFMTGTGPLVEGPLLALVMVMAGRERYLDHLTGDGLSELGARLRK
ncbi:maleylpyruvate isomerase family mycothiol-dependent enzyme [Populibacterium corticicola]|uniref:Maleylpyruvate isomerase family mycothiol-dependent enzyme n=1 Tax=Populibacterium corticicola TaxID=1812826 RepID=A0ABW5XC59_9MICO